MKIVQRIAIVVALASVLSGRAFGAEDARWPNGIHYRPEKGAFADAIPFFWKGTYHVFYLHAGLGGTTWDHIASTDLLHWQELPAALKPGTHDAPDGDCVFTGSIFEHDGVFHAFYTGWNPSDPNHREQIMHATSPDLAVWTKHPELTFHADGAVYQDDHGKDFRDPLVFWNEATKEFWMLLYARRTSDGMGVTAVWTSSDLLAWRPASPVEGMDAGECPDYFEFGGRPYILNSRGGMWWQSAASLREVWQKPKVPKLDTPLLYAVKRLFDGKRHIAFGFVRDLEGGRDFGAMNWGGTMCLPREVFRSSQGDLRVRPVAELDLAFGDPIYSLTDAEPAFDSRAGEWKLESGELRGRGDVSVAIKAPADYMLRATVKSSPIARIEFRFRDQGPEAGGYSLVIDREHQISEIRGPLHVFVRTTPIPSDAPVRVQAFVIGNIIECFVNDEIAFTTRAYDFPAGGLSITCNEGGATISELTICGPKAERR